MPGYHVPHRIRVSELRRKRIEKGLEQKQLAELSGIPYKTIANFEQRRRNIGHARVNIVYALAAALDCRMEDLIEKEKL